MLRLVDYRKSCKNIKMAVCHTPETRDERHVKTKVFSNVKNHYAMLINQGIEED